MITAAYSHTIFPVLKFQKPTDQNRIPMKTHSKILRGFSWVPSLYIAEGLPYAVVMTLAGVMYNRMGIPNGDMAFYTSLLSLPWVIKPVWSPFVDIFGTRRRWILATQILMATALACVALALPGHSYFRYTMASFMAMAFLSATHDIAADGFYIEALDSAERSFFVGIRTTFYRIALVLVQGVLVALAGTLEICYGDIPQAWTMVFLILSALMGLMAVYHIIVLPRPEAAKERKPHTIGRVWKEFVQSFVSFFTKPGIWGALLFILLYRMPEGQLIRLIPPFLLDSPENGGIGLTTTQEGFAYGIVGIIGLLTGGVLGGILAARGGLRRWLMPMAWSMSLTCLSFVYLSFATEPSLLTVNVCVCVEQFGYGFGCTAYTLYLMDFSRGDRPASHYAICTGFMALGMMLSGMIAGYIQEAVGYRSFFLWTTACCAVTIGVCYLVRRQKGIMAAVLLFGTVTTLSSCTGSGSSSDAETAVPADSVAVPAVEEVIPEEPDSVLTGKVLSPRDLTDFMTQSPDSARYRSGILPRMVTDNASYAERLLRSRYPYFIVVDKPSMYVVLYDRCGVEIDRFRMNCSRNYGTKHKRRDNRTPEGFFSAEGIYDSEKWLYTDDDGVTSPVKGQFGPRFIRLKTPVTSQVGIHGTCTPWSLGRRGSHGCIRIHNDNIMRLVEYVEPSTPIIVNPSQRDLEVNAEEGFDVPFINIGIARRLHKPEPPETAADTVAAPADSTLVQPADSAAIAPIALRSDTITSPVTSDSI